MRVVLDPAVLVKGVLDPRAPEGRLLDLALSEALVVLHDDRVLLEYAEAFARLPVDLPSDCVEELIEFVAAAGLSVTPSLGPTAYHSSSTHRVALEGCADALVTSDGSVKRTKQPEGLRICSACELLQTLR
jgi:predicted nucleic acid-binding protein